MADVEKRIVISVDADQAEKDLKDIKDALKETSKEVDRVEEQNKKTSKSFGMLGEAGKTAGKGLSAVGRGLKTIFAAVGIIALISKLTEMFMANEKIANAVNKVMTTMQIVMNKVVDVVTELWKGMDSTKLVIKNLIKVAFTPLKLALNTLMLGVKSFQLAWTKAFDKKNTEKIAELTGEVDELKDKLKEVAKDGVEAVKGVVKNLGGMVKEISGGIKTVVTEMKDFNVKAARETAEALIKMRENVGEQLASLQGDLELLDAASERLRQDRDDTTKSFEERKKASDNLLKNIELEREKLLQIANTRLRLAQLELAANNNSETRTSLAEAEKEIKATQATIEGKISEQKAAQLGLSREILAEEEEMLKIMEEEDKLADEKKAKEKQDRLDALTKEYNEELAMMKLMQEEDDAATQAKIDNINKQQDAALASLNAVADVDKALTQASLGLLQNKLNKGKISQEEYDKKVADIQRKAAIREKGYAISNTIINTMAAIMKALTLDPTGILATINGVLGAAQIAAIIATPVDGTGGGRVPQTSTSTSAAPSSGTAPMTSFNFDTKADTQELSPIKTYVVGKDVQTQQQLDREIVANATL